MSNYNLDKDLVDNITIASQVASVVYRKTTDPEFHKRFSSLRERLDEIGYQLISFKHFYKDSDKKKLYSKKAPLQAGMVFELEKDDKRFLFIGFHGTKTFHELRSDFINKRVYYSFGEKTLRMHKGFLREYKDSKNELDEILVSRINKNPKISKYIFAGHSLGGAIASISSVSYSLNGVISPDQSQVYAFGAPKVFCKETAKIVEEIKFDSFIRINLTNDPIPSFLSKRYFQHVGDCLTIKGKGIFSHVMRKYNIALKDYIINMPTQINLKTRNNMMIYARKMISYLRSFYNKKEI